MLPDKSGDKEDQKSCHKVKLCVRKQWQVTYPGVQYYVFRLWITTQPILT